MIVALFRTENALSHALHRLRDARIGPLETYTPAPLRDERVFSPIPMVILAAGLFGAAASFALQAYSSIVAYRFDIGGRPPFAWPSFTPTVFENAVLVAIGAGFAAFMIVNRLPKLYDPVDEAAAMRRASGDGWVLCLRNEDSGIAAHARALLDELDPASVEEVSP